MTRAGVFIGVNRSGKLTTLKDAASGARRMHQWAIGQGMVDQQDAHLITDDGGAKVHPQQLYDIINGIVEGPGVDQLIVYFAGHGVNINHSEYWLLSDAPTNTSAAVNVAGSADLARYGAIKHVVFISDACRVAPLGIQAQNVRGCEIFPNTAGNGKAQSVDMFFACLLGRASAEISNPADAAAGYSALYTGALLDALSGARPEVLEPATALSDPHQYVKPHPLENFLEHELPIRIAARNLQTQIMQEPDAIITSKNVWVSRVLPRSGMHPMAGSPQSPPAPSFTGPCNDQMYRAASSGTWEAVFGSDRQAKAMADAARTIAAPFGPQHFETECGIKVRGGRIVEHHVPGAADVEVLDPEHQFVRLHGVPKPGVNALLRFDGDVGTVVPVIPGFITSLTLESGELVDVGYEPSDNTWRGAEYKLNNRFRVLRAIAASFSRHGRFRVEGPNALDLAKEMQTSKTYDPSFSIYAAYAYHSLGERARIESMLEYLRADLGFVFFDLAMLARKLNGVKITPDSHILPCAPMLGQGWSLLSANRVELPAGLNRLSATLRPSLWSLYDRRGLEMLEFALKKGAVR